MFKKFQQICFIHYLLYHHCCNINKTKGSEIVACTRVLPEMVSLLLHRIAWSGRWIVEDRGLQKHLDLGAVLHGDTESIDGLLLGLMMYTGSNPLVLPLSVLFLCDLLWEWSKGFLDWMLDCRLEVFHLFSNILKCNKLVFRVLCLQSSMLLHSVVVLLLDPDEDLRQIEFPNAEVRL